MLWLVDIIYHFVTEMMLHTHKHNKHQNIAYSFSLLFQGSNKKRAEKVHVLWMLLGFLLARIAKGSFVRFIASLESQFIASLSYLVGNFSGLSNDFISSGQFYGERYRFLHVTDVIVICWKVDSSN